MGLDKMEFEKFMKELVIVYTEISKEKAKIYYEFFVDSKITIEDLQKAKKKLYQTKTTSFFPTMAEIYELSRKKTIDEALTVK